MYVDATDERFQKVMGSYAALSEWARPLHRMERELVGRDDEIRTLMAAFHRPELSNVILLGTAGSGKTAIVQGAMMRDERRIYLEVDMAAMVDGLVDQNQIGTRLQQLFDETGRFQASTGREIVLFIDEFHKIVQKSPAAVEDLKPLLADSGTRGIRVVAATTYDEFREYIAPNQPLVERLQRINVSEADHDMTLAILKGMCRRYEVEGDVSESLLESIYTYTQRYIPANAQPRKSILILDAMVGWHRAEGRRFDRKLLGEVIYQQEGIKIDTQVDPLAIRDGLDEVVFAQRYATLAVAKRMQLCLAGLNDPEKPQSTLLFSGGTGVGKGTTESTLIPVYDPNGEVFVKRAGDIVPGDYVFSRDGRPEQVVGVFPQGYKDVYKVTLTDGRSLVVDGSHLWGVYPSKQDRCDGLTVYSTETLLRKGLMTQGKHGYASAKYVIPMNRAVQWPARDVHVDSYVIGVALGHGSMTGNAVCVSSADEFTITKFARLLGADVQPYVSRACNFDWYFSKEMRDDGSHVRVQWDDVLVDVPQLKNLESGQKFIPDVYKFSSIDQRWSLIRGLFDANGSIDESDGYRVSYSTTSEHLALDVQFVLHSLGFGAMIDMATREGKLVEYRVNVKAEDADKRLFFTLPRKLERACQAARERRQRVRSFDYVGIRSIEPMYEQQKTVCLYVADDEHLYQAGDFIVTHNTAVAKRLAELLFGDARDNLIRFDMTEFSQPESAERFRVELTNAVWAHPFSVVLLDEIEKACGEVTRMLLPVLDDGRLTDANGRVVTFTNAHIILTTNAGSEVYRQVAQYEASDTGEGEFLERYERTIRDSLMRTTGGSRFPPELLGRIDAIVPFQPISHKTMHRIAKNELLKLRRRLRLDHGIEFDCHPRVIAYVVENRVSDDSDAGGARQVIQTLESDVTCAIAAYINAHPGETQVYAWVHGLLASEQKTELKNRASIRIGTKADFDQDDEGAGAPGL